MAKRKEPVDENGIPYEQPFAGYEIYDKADSNSLVTTWLARDLRMLRDVVLKVVTPSFEINEDFVEEFFAEASGVARLRHKNIVRGLDTGRSGMEFLFVLEYFPADKLGSIIDSGRKFKEEKALDIVGNILKALDLLYEEGIAHGNINPNNIMIGRDRVVRLDELGLPLRVLFNSTMEQAFALPEYAAPELFEEDSFSDIGSDVYALGTCLYQMLCGRLPFEAVDTGDLINKKQQEEPVPIRKILPNISEITSDLVMSMIAMDSGERVVEPNELIEKLCQHPAMDGKFEVVAEEDIF